uniref:sulfatase-like hydrolase/transferase n=1 Tax=Salmonella enterica TaxID=28901 RepID=UPI00398C3CD6
LVIVASRTRGGMSGDCYPCETTPELDALHKTYPGLTVVNNVVTSPPYTIEVLQQALTFADEKNPDWYLTRPSLMNMMKQAGYKTLWITNTQTLTPRNTYINLFSKLTHKQVYLNQLPPPRARAHATHR